MSRTFIWLFPLFILVAYLATPAKAVVGEVDAENEFPFVVQLFSQYSSGKVSSCSAVAGTDILVSTAAHCVYDDDEGEAEHVLLQFVDPEGAVRQSEVMNIFVPDEYQAKSTIARSKRGTPDHSAAFYQAAVHDIAFLVPKNRVQTAGYLRWGTEILMPPFANVIGNAHGINGDRGDVAVAVTNELGVIGDMEAKVVGFGNFSCTDFNDRENNCTSDGVRRKADVKLKTPFAEPNLSPPWLWCTGQDKAGVNPVQHGDSGGALFVKHRSRWLFVGYHSGGNNLHSCASSFYSNLQLFFSTYKVDDSWVRRNYEWKGSRQGHRSIARQFVREFYESWSSPNEQALSDIGYFYQEGGFPDTTYFYGERLPFAALKGKKEKFAANWPFRHYSPNLDEMEVDCGDGGECKVEVNVKFAVADASGNTSEGTTRASLSISLPFMEAITRHGRIVVSSEDEMILEKNGERVADVPVKGMLTGRYAPTLEQCEAFLNYELTELSRGEASNAQVLNVHEKGFDWSYSLSGCSTDERLKVGTQRATCYFKDNEWSGNVTIKRKASGAISLTFDFPTEIYAGTSHFIPCRE